MDSSVKVKDLFHKVEPKDPRKIYIDTKYLKFIGLALILLIAVPFTLNGAKAEKLERQVCANFKTQQEAQRTYDRYIKTVYSKYVKRMDADHDGVACEHLRTK